MHVVTLLLILFTQRGSTLFKTAGLHRPLNLSFLFLRCHLSTKNSKTFHHPLTRLLSLRFRFWNSQYICCLSIKQFTCHSMVPCCPGLMLPLQNVRLWSQGDGREILDGTCITMPRWKKGLLSMTEFQGTENTQAHFSRIFSMTYIHQTSYVHETEAAHE